MVRPRKKQYSKGSNIYQRIKDLDSIKELYKKNPSKAKSELIHHLEEHPEDMYAEFFYGQICENEGNFDEAEESYTKVADSNSPNKYGGVFGLAEIARKKNNIPLAKKYYYKAILESSREQKSSIYTVARLERLEGNYEQALKVLGLIKNKTAECEIEKTKVIIAQGNLEEALNKSESIIPSTPSENRELNLLKARLYAALGNPTKAEYYFLLAKENSPKDSQYYKILFEEGKFLIQQGHYQEALDNYEEINRTGETLHGNIYYEIGQTKESLRQFQSALTSYSMAIMLKETSDEVRSISHFSKGMLEFAMGDFYHAEQDLKTNLQINEATNNVTLNSAIYALISIYIRQQRYLEAEQIIEKAKSLTTDSRELDQLETASLIVAKKQNKPLESYKRNYRDSQVINYSKKLAITHIKEHHQSSDPTTSQFARNIDISTLYDEISSQMTEETRVNTDIMDKYFIDYPNAGYTPEGDIINRIGVVAIPGPKDIITMYPDSENKAIRQSDILKTMPQEKTKASDRISKFNARFSKQSN